MNALCNVSYTSGIREFQYVVIGSLFRTGRDSYVLVTHFRREKKVFSPMNALCNVSYTSGIREFQYVVIGS